MVERKGEYRGDLREIDHFEDLGVDGRIKLKYMFKKWDERHELYDQAQDRDSCRAVVNAVMNLRFL
jgi:hypothetical protein